MNQRHDAAQCLVDAGTVFRKSNHQLALDAYKEAVDILTDMGRFTMAAKHLASCGDIHVEQNDSRKAVESYQQAADYGRLVKFDKNIDFKKIEFFKKIDFSKNRFF